MWWFRKDQHKKDIKPKTEKFESLMEAAKKIQEYCNEQKGKAAGCLDCAFYHRDRGRCALTFFAPYTWPIVNEAIRKETVSLIELDIKKLLKERT